MNEEHHHQDHSHGTATLRDIRRLLESLADSALPVAARAGGLNEGRASGVAAYDCDAVMPLDFAAGRP